MHPKIFFLCFMLLPIYVFAGDVSEADIDTRYVYLHSEYKVNDDATHVEQHEWAMKVLHERAIEYAKDTTISYSTSIQKAEVLKAYTLKPDGRRIEAPKTNYQIRTDTGRGENAPVFSDRTKLTVVFPEVQVGDTVVFSHKLTQTQALFPGHFTASAVFYRYYPYDDVRVKLDLPKSLDGQNQAREMSEKVTSKGDRKIIELRFDNKIPVQSKRRDYSIMDIESEPGFTYSTFKSYEEIAQAYGVRATPKSKVTDRVSNLAAEIVGDTKDKKAQARLLYEWVATNITYAGNCIGVGAVVPHDLDFVLDNRMGDCKDHATLLQALLAARGVLSTQALINAGEQYRLPSVPMVNAVNHVINYLPDYELFVDSTSSDTPFGHLHFKVSDKPVLLVDGYQDGIKTPVPPIGSNQQFMKTAVHIKPDGSASGEIIVNQKGVFAVNTRARLRRMNQKQEDELIKNVFRSESTLGSGSLDKDDPSALIDTYTYKVKFEKSEFIQRPGAGAFNITPLFPNEAPVLRFIASAVNPMEEVDVACSNGKSVEEYSYTFPKDMKLLAKPEDVHIDGKYLRYSATYEYSKNVLKVIRTVEDLAPGNICSPELMKSQREVGLKAIQNLKSQVLYQ